MKREKYSETIYRDIRDKIAAGIYPVSTKLPNEREFAMQYQVSRFPVREAIARLEEEGVLEIRQGTGTYVQNRTQKVEKTFEEKPIDPGDPISKDILWETLTLRKLLEVESARLAALNITPDGLVRLEQALIASIQEIRKLKQGEDNTFFESDREFHYAIARECGNPILLPCLQSMKHIISTHQHLSLGVTSQRDEVVTFHTAIYESILARDATATANSMRRHMERIEEHIQFGIEKKKSK